VAAGGPVTARGASSIRDRQLDLWMNEKVVPVRSPSSSAARKVLAQTIRTAVARSAQAAVPSCRLVIAKEGRVGPGAPGSSTGSSRGAGDQTARPPARTPAGSPL